MSVVGDTAVRRFDLAETAKRDLNQALHELAGPASVEILHPAGLHSIAAGMTSELDVEIRGHVGYYCAGMNQRARMRVHGNCGVGVAENMMSGSVTVEGDASQSAGASAHGGLLVIEGDASARCGISLKGAEIVVQGSVGHMCAFMAQSGTIVVCGDAGEALGDSLYEAQIFVRGSVKSLGADCEEKDMAAEHRERLADLIGQAGVHADADEFRRYGSARRLYNFNVDNLGAY